MRIIPAAALFAAAAATGACNVESDSANEQVRIDYDREKMRDAASTAARTARDVGSAAGNVAATTGRAISNEVGDVDVDLKVTRNRERAAAEVRARAGAEANLQ